MNLLALADELLEKVRGLARAHRRHPRPARAGVAGAPARVSRPRAELVVIGTSTGGPRRCRR
jgi:chemotaxis response regulator CheB